MSRTICVTVDTTVDVDVDMEDFTDSDLIDELEERGFIIHDPDDYEDPMLNKEECELILDRVGWDAKPGTDLYSAIEKLKDLYYRRRQ